MTSVQRVWEQSEEDTKANALAALTGPAWTLVTDNGNTVTLDFLGDRGSMYFTSREGSDTLVGYTDQTVTYTTSFDVN